MLVGVRHARLVIHRCFFDGDELTVRLATLVAVHRQVDPADDPPPTTSTAATGSSGVAASLDWEVVAEATAEVETELGRARLDLVVISGADEHGNIEFSEVRGDAVVVRYLDRSVVWRGDGPLEGFDDAWLTNS
jgi:hypothetical protein